MSLDNRVSHTNTSQRQPLLSAVKKVEGGKEAALSSSYLMHQKPAPLESSPLWIHQDPRSGSVNNATRGLVESWGLQIIT